MLRALLIFLLTVFLGACLSVPAPIRSQKAVLFHVVSPGESLYAIAWQYGKDVHTLAKLNQLKEPYRVYPGQKLKLTVQPPPSLSLPHKGGGDKKAPSVEKGQALVPSVEKGQALVPPFEKGGLGGISETTKDSAEQTPQFIWPTQGKIIQSFDPENGEKGIDIAGDLNQPIQAIAEGKVVYSGQGLLGYGNLVIIKHQDDLLSAYAHNQTILVREGDKIKQGAVIAQMGKTGTDRVKLHFELRKNGKPSDPLRYLPHR